MGGRVQILRAAAYQRMPWKNGGGETFEIAVSPPRSAFDELDWRISMALVTQDGPFSMLPQIDRTLCVLDGAALELDFGAEGETRQLTANSPPFSFSADIPLYARIATPVVDLNVMTRRGRFAHRVRRERLDRSLLCTSRAQTLLVFCARGSACVHATPSATAILGPRDTALVEPGGGELTIAPDPALEETAVVYLIELHRLDT